MVLFKGIIFFFIRRDGRLGNGDMWDVKNFSF